jgi:hypothetical protein
MRRNDEAIKKTIKYHTKKCAEISNTIFISFKRIYFDLKIKQKINFCSLGHTPSRNMISTSIKRFIKDDESSDRNDKNDKIAISIDTELKAFLKSTGNKLEDKDIEFMLHLVYDLNSLDKGKITRDQLYEIYGAIAHFSKKKPEKILNFVLDHYFKNDKLDSSDMDLDKVRHFFETYSEYFTKEQKNYVIQECYYLGQNFSRDAFNYMVLSMRKYYPY